MEETKGGGERRGGVEETKGGGEERGEEGWMRVKVEKTKGGGEEGWRRVKAEERREERRGG